MQAISFMIQPIHLNAFCFVLFFFLRLVYTSGVLFGLVRVVFVVFVHN